MNILVLHLAIITMRISPHFFVMFCQVFPVKLRTSGMGLLSAAGRIGAIAGQFANGSLENNVPLLLFVTAGCMLLGGICSFFIVHETGNAIN